MNVAAADLEQRERARAEAAAAERVNTLQAQKEAFETAAEARLRVIEEQRRALDSYRRLDVRERLRTLLTPRLGVLYQYDPVPMRVPPDYRRQKSLTATPVVSIV